MKCSKISNSWKQIVLLGLMVLSFTVQAAPAAKKIKVGLVLDKGGRDDKSFNAAAYKGATEAQKQLGIELKVVESSDDTALEPSLRTFAQHNYDLIIGIGFVQITAMKKVAAQFPNAHFLLVDSPLAMSNVRSIIFKEHEGSYLVGAIAALTSKTGKIGFIGGMDIPLIRRFQMGYEAGVKATRPKDQVLTNYVGSTSDSWRNPMKAKELALSQYAKGADIIFVAAGASGMGVFDAAEEQKKFAVGVDSNQNWVKPGFILTSMVKRVDSAVFDTIKDTQDGKFTAGSLSLGLAEKAIDFSVDENNRKVLTPEVQKKAEEIRTQILQGKLHPPDYYELDKKTGKSS